MKAPPLFAGGCWASGHNNLKALCSNVISQSGSSSQQSLADIVLPALPDVRSFVHQDGSNGDRFSDVRTCGSWHGGQDTVNSEGAWD